ncbi:hypothetical protein AVW11_01475 [Streptomyces amritsarensis]|uniref:Uncharacterized protein n=1 Tax=Streptomyces amritsarensis TaxID=681158 RepID=A0ABX3GAE7_9ACTN|nr:hypothetical protein AVW11_01475 [Streptomyces amritsarensis]
MYAPLPQSRAGSVLVPCTGARRAAGPAASSGSPSPARTVQGIGIGAVPAAPAVRARHPAGSRPGRATAGHGTGRFDLPGPSAAALAAGSAPLARTAPPDATTPPTPAPTPTAATRPTRSARVRVTACGGLTERAVDGVRARRPAGRTAW